MESPKNWWRVYPDELARVSAIFCIVMDELLTHYLVSFGWCGGSDKKSQRLLLLLLCGCSASSLCFEYVRSPDTNQECTEWGVKGSICFARVRQGCGFTLERGLDLSRLERLKGWWQLGYGDGSVVVSALAWWSWLCGCLGTGHSYCSPGWIAKVPLVKLASVGVDTAHWFTDLHLNHVDLDNKRLSSDKTEWTSDLPHFYQIIEILGVLYNFKGGVGSPNWPVLDFLPTGAVNI